MDRNYNNIITTFPHLFGIWRLAKKAPHIMEGTEKVPLASF